MKKCKHCEESLKDHWTECPRCGREINPAQVMKILPRFFISESNKEDIKSRLVKNYISFNNAIIKVDNSFDHMDSLKVFDVSLYQGKLILNVKTEDYLLANQLKLLSNVLNGLDFDKRKKFRNYEDFPLVLLSNLESSSSANRKELDDFLQLIEREIYYVKLDNNNSATINYYSQGFVDDRYRHYGNLVTLSLCYKRFLSKEIELADDKHNAMYCFHLIEIAMVEAYANIDTKETMMALIQAEEKMAYAKDYEMLCYLYKQLYDDDDKVLSILNKLDKLEDIKSLISSAKIYKYLLDDDKTSMSRLSKAQSKCRNEWEYQQCSDYWAVLFNDKNNAYNCLIEKQNHTTERSTGEYIRLAYTWNNLNEYEMVKKNLLLAMNQENDFMDWIVLSMDWLSLSDDIKQSIACVTSAEKLAKDLFEDWKKCFDIWSLKIKDIKNATRCLVECEKYATKWHHWMFCCNSWFDLCGDKLRAENALKNAEKYASYSMEWDMVGDLWLKKLNNKNKSDECYKIANKTDDSKIDDYLTDDYE